MSNQNEQIIHEFLQSFNKGGDAVAALFDEEAIIEFPYAHSLGTPGKLPKTDYHQYLNNVLPNMPGLQFSQVQIFNTISGNMAWAEFHGEATIPSTGVHYQQDYVARFTFRDGKIIHYKEYWNVAPGLEAFGGKHKTQEQFTHQTK